MQTDKKSDLYALLIGIDCYLPNMLPDKSSYPRLSGCVRDIRAVKTFLEHDLQLPHEHIFLLTATNTSASEPPEPREQWPTYEHIIAAFQSITELAQQGDQVYIHYSGHGGRTPTLLPEQKGEHGLDEALVPLDIGNSTERYVRDIELSDLLRQMVEKGLIVTVVLDSCHSGSATRGPSEDAVRGLDIIDTTSRPMQSLVASKEILAQTWQRVSEGGTRGVALGSGWLPEVKDYVLLAACRANESAYEHRFDGSGKHGVLTYWFLHLLRQLGTQITYKQLHDQIVARIHSEFVQQTPQLQGDATRLVFNVEHNEQPYAVNVMRVDLAQQRVLLNTGQSQVVRQGAQFEIYPPGIIDFTLVNTRQALVEITEVGATDSWSHIIAAFSSELIVQGAQAVLINPGAIRLRRTVRSARQEQIPTIVAQDRALEQVERAILQYGKNFVSLAGSHDTTDYQVAVTPKGNYEIWDPAGVPIVNLRPALHVAKNGAAEQVVQRLVHLTKYRNVQQLDNADVFSPLRGKLIVELVGKQEAYDPVDRPEPQPFDDPGNTPIIKPGEWTFLRIKNTSRHVLNVTVLDLGPDWSIKQIYPSPQDTAFMPFDSGQEVLLPLEAYLPEGYTDAVDVLKVFATVGSTSFRWLELPALDQPHLSKSTRGLPKDALEQLLAMIAADTPPTRHLNPAVYPTREWTTVQVEVHVRSS